MSKPAVLSLPMQTLETASPKAKEVLEKAQKQVGFIPNMYGLMVNLPALLDTYLYGYNKFRADSGLTPVEQEVVLLSISRENTCHYCVAAHSLIADKFSNVPREITDAIRNGAEIADPKLRALSKFTKILVETRGRPARVDVLSFLTAGYTEEHILAILLAVSVKTISNYSNHLLETPLDEMFQPRVWQPD